MQPNHRRHVLLQHEHTDFAASLNVAGQGRFKGWYTVGTGIAAEIGVAGGEGYIDAYDRTNSVYKPLHLNGSTMDFGINGTPILKIDSSGNVAINDTPVSGVGLRVQSAGITNAGVELSSINLQGNILCYDRAASTYRKLVIAADTIQAQLASAEFRLVYDGAYVSFYNTANNTRTGYLQMVTTGDTNLANEQSARYINLNVTNGGAVNISTSNNATSNFKAASRTTLVLSGVTDTIAEWNIGTTTYGYLYASATELRLNAFQNIIYTLYTNNTLRETCSAAGAFRWHAYGAGTLTTDASGNITAVSDERLKKDFRPYARGLAAIELLQPQYYRWSAKSGMETEHEYAGWVAQNVQKAIPEAVFEQPDGMLGLQERPIQAALVNAVQELSARVKQIEQHINH